MLNGSSTAVLTLCTFSAITGYLAQLSKVMIAPLFQHNHQQYARKYEAKVKPLQLGFIQKSINTLLSY